MRLNTNPGIRLRLCFLIPEAGPVAQGTNTYLDIFLRLLPICWRIFPQKWPKPENISNSTGWARKDEEPFLAHHQ